MENLEIYNKLKKVPKEAKKQITGGRLSGMTDIKPMWRIEKLTEIFGMCGVGWKAPIKNKEIIEGANGERIAVVDIDLYVKVDGKWSDAIEGTGGSSFISKEKNGLYTSDECFKMAYTDALSVACKSLGMGAEVYWGDSKYDTTKEPTLKEAKEYTITFGKNKGKKLSEVDDGYLNWLLNSSNDPYILKCIELLTGKKQPTEDEFDERIELLGKLDKLLIETEVDREKFYESYKVESDSDMSNKQLQNAIEILEKRVQND